MTTTLFVNAEIYSPRDMGSALAGKHQGKLVHIPCGALAVKDGLIASLGSKQEVLKTLKGEKIDKEIDCRDQCLVPGFVDPHTHMCFARRRESEFEMRILGTPYLEILERGGGILSSVKAVAETTEEDLYAFTLKTVMKALSFGTTTVEIKSGYGLDTLNELKMLSVIRKIKETTPLDVVPTFLGAHAVPSAWKANPDGFVDLIIQEMLPEVSSQGIAKFCDVFIEKGVFSLAQGRRILEAARALGMGLKIHADEVNDLGSAGLAADLKAISADHLLAACPANFDRMASHGVVATLLPATAYSLKKPYARAREMIQRDLPVALATDCNPGSSFTESMPFVIGLAVLAMDLTPAEALTGATLNAAYALGIAHSVGSLDPGKQADFLLLDGDSPSILAYHAGVNPVTCVYKKGRQVICND